MRKWTPDFAAGPIGLEVEALLRDYVLKLRVAGLAQSALKMVARPDDVRSARGAWGYVALEAADAGFIWYRTRTWRSLQDPVVIAVDSVVGLVGVTLGTRSMTTRSQLEDTAWTNRQLESRFTGAPIGDRHAGRLLTVLGMHLLPIVVWPPPCTGRRIARLLLLPLAGGATQWTVISRRMRDEAVKLDVTVARWALEELAVAIVNETESFRTTVLGPIPDALRQMRDALPTDRAAAAAIAASEERRLRLWMVGAERRATSRTDAERVVRMDVVEADIRRLSRAIQGGGRVLFSTFDVIGLSKRTHRDPRVARIARCASAARGLVGAAVATDLLRSRFDERSVQRLVSVTDLLMVGAAEWHRRAEGDAQPLARWVERLVWEVAATSGAARVDTPELRFVHAAIAAICAGFRLTDRGTGPATTHGRSRARGASPLRPSRQRAAAAVHDVVMVEVTAHQTLRLFERAVEQGKKLTASSIDLGAQWDELGELQLRQRAFIHDGVLQLLAAMRSATIDDGALSGWISRELSRLESTLTGPAARDGLDRWNQADLTAAVEELVDEFAARGLTVLTETWAPPEWIRPSVGTVVGIVREGLNNVLKHTDQRWAWLSVAPAEDQRSVTVRVTDFATADAQFVPGSGTGTRLMMSLARRIDADLDWLFTTSGGTQVRLVVHDRPVASVPV